VTSLSHLQSSLWTDYISDINYAAHLVSSSTALAFVNNRSEKRKSTAASAIQVKNCFNTVGTEWKFDTIS